MAESVEAREDLVALTGPMAVPGVVVDGQAVIGVGKAKLRALLAIP